MFSEQNPKKVTIQKIHEEIGQLDHIKNPAKYAARLG